MRDGRRRGMTGKKIIGAALVLALAIGGAGGAAAQVRTVDPNNATDLAPVPAGEATYGTKVTPPAAQSPPPASTQAASPEQAPSSETAVGAAPADTRTQAADAAQAGTYAQEDVV